MTDGLDDIDLKIVAELSRDAKVPYSRLAAECGVTRQTIASRVRRLEKEGVIKRYRAAIDYSRLGLKSFFILFLKLDVSDEPRMKEFIASIKKDPSVLMDVSVTGEWDVMLLLAFCSVKEYEYYINGLRVRMGPLLKDSKSHVILDFYKSIDDYVPARQP